MKTETKTNDCTPEMPFLKNRSTEHMSIWFSIAILIWSPLGTPDFSNRILIKITKILSISKQKDYSS